MTIIDLKTKDGQLNHVKCWTVDEFINNSLFTGFTPRFKRLYNTRNDDLVAFYLTEFCTFDIETTRIEMDTEFYTFMYQWQMTVCGVLIMGRTWEDWEKLMLFLQHKFGLTDRKKCLVFIHNLPYEFAFIHGRYPVNKLFARQTHAPITVEFGGALSGFEFRCTYSNSGKSLAQLAEDTPSCPYYKDKSDLDYSVLRTQSTVLTKTELTYCAKDVLILDFYIRHCITVEKKWNKNHGFVASIPLTKTGYVRREAKRVLTNDPEWMSLRDRLKLNGHQYVMAAYAFRGGDTHPQAWACGNILETYSFDLTSSYPYRLIAEKFPASQPITVANPTIEDVEWLLNSGKHFIVDVSFTKIKFRGLDFFDYLPCAKCGTTNEKIDNGRIISADVCRTIVTEIDLKIIFDNYEYSELFVNHLFYFEESAYLPDSLRLMVLNYYKDKTTLKGVSGEELRYLQSKMRINSIFGMMVTSTIYDEVKFQNGEWTVLTTPLSYKNENIIDRELAKQYKKTSYFLPYIVGVYVTAYARQDLHRALSRIKSDSIYWDTDSVKYINDHHDVFDQLNAEKMDHLRDLGFPDDLISPADIKGNHHPIGLWDPEYGGKTVEFKTFGAKKYIYMEGGKPHVTISGLSKQAAIYVHKTLGNILSLELNFTIPESDSGRTVSQYRETPFTFNIDGDIVHEESYMNIIPTTYTLSDTPEHILYAALSYQEYKIREEAQ